MKKVISLFIIALLLLSGCLYSTPEHGKYAFYYLQQEYLHNSDSSVLAAERRTVEGNQQAILESYLKGPKSSNLSSPFPEGTSLQSLSLENECLTIDLGDSFASLTDIRLTLACTALAQTCFDIYKIETVRIQAGSSLLADQSQIIIGRDSVLLSDNYTVEEAT